MLNALNQKKKEYEAKIDSIYKEIANLEANAEHYEEKVAIVNEMIEEELKKQEESKPVETVQSVIAEDSDEAIVVCGADI